MKKSCVLLGIVAISFAVAAVHGEKAKEALKGENSFANFCATFCGPNQPRTPPCIQKGCYSGGGSRHSNARSHHSNARSHRSNVRSRRSYDHTRYYKRGAYSNQDIANGNAVALLMRERNAQEEAARRIFRWPHLRTCFDNLWENDRETWYRIMESPFIHHVSPCRNNMAKAKTFREVKKIFSTMKGNQASRRRRLLETTSESVNSKEELIAQSSSYFQGIYDGYVPTLKRTSGHLCDENVFDGVKYDKYGRFNWKCHEAPNMCKCIGAMSECFKKNDGGCQMSFEGDGNLELHFTKSGNNMQ